MLRPRIIPSLLIQDNGLVKTVNFKNPKYVGDPINAVKIFNEKEVDELAIFDIDATAKGISREPVGFNFSKINQRNINSSKNGAVNSARIKKLRLPCLAIELMMS